MWLERDSRGELSSVEAPGLQICAYFTAVQRRYTVAPQSGRQAQGHRHKLHDLRPNGFLQNIFAYHAPSIRTQGAFYVAMGDAKVSYVDVSDIAVVAVKALAGGAHSGKLTN